jgi:membrane protein DedA with SNARE-associated domain
MVSAGSVTGQLTDWVGQHGVYAVFVLMAVDAVLPAGGELVMLYAGALAAGAVAGQHPAVFGSVLHTGAEAYMALALAGTLGYLAGALAGWAIGRFGGSSLVERHGRWLHLGPARLQRAQRWFERRGAWAVFLGRLTPLVRSFVSIPAGVMRSPLPSYTLLTLLGSAIWCFGFAAAGWALGSRYEQVHHAIRYLDMLLVGLILLAIVAATLAARRRDAPA